MGIKWITSYPATTDQQLRAQACARLTHSVSSVSTRASHTWVFFYIYFFYGAIGLSCGGDPSPGFLTGNFDFAIGFFKITRKQGGDIQSINYSCYIRLKSATLARFVIAVECAGMVSDRRSKQKVQQQHNNFQKVQKQEMCNYELRNSARGTQMCNPTNTVHS